MSEAKVQEVSEVELKEIISAGLKDSEMAKDLNTLKSEVENLKAVKSDSRENRAEVSKKFLSDVLTGNTAELKTITTNANSMGYTVPTELAAAVHEKKDKIAKIRAKAFVFKMDGNFDLPTEGTGVTAYWVTTEADSDLTEANPTTSKKSLVDNYLAARVRIPYKLLATSGINVEDYVSRLSSRALIRQEETAFVGGSGSGEPTGFRQLTITPTYQAGSNFAYDDLVNLYFSLDEQYRANAVWLMSTKAIKLCMKLKDTYGMPIFNPVMNTIMGKPYLEVTDIPENLGTTANETEIWIADLQEYWIKDGETMIAERRQVPGRLQVDLFLYESTDGIVVNSDAFKFITGVK